MAGTLIQSEFVYRSPTSSGDFQFTIVSNSQGLLYVRDLQNPYGFILSPQSPIPKTVTDDISAAMGQVENLLAVTSVANGFLEFDDETSRSVTFATAMEDDGYRVLLSPAIFSTFRITNKTTAGFTVESDAAITGSVGYDVLI